MNKMLLVIDAQYDFIDGTLPVPGAGAAMDKLADYVREHDGEFVVKIATADFHPYNHCSFTDFGGQWPRHCVQESRGAAIWDKLLAALNETKGVLKVLHKGDSAAADEYSIFKNEASAKILDLIIRQGIEKILVAGIAGDVCVLNTVEDGIKRYGSGMFEIMPEFCPSLDGGAKLNELIFKLKK